MEMSADWALAGGTGKSLPSRLFGTWSSLGQRSREARRAAYWGEQGQDHGCLPCWSSIGTRVCFREETGTSPPQHHWVAVTLVSCWVLVE